MENAWHDKFFKQVFSIEVLVKSFILNYLPSEITKYLEFNTLEEQAKNFMNPWQNEISADFIYKIKYKGKDSYIFLLFEHKSYSDKDIFMQFLIYIVSIWRKEKGYRFVFPILIYQGEKEWTNIRLSDNVEGITEGMKKFIPDFEFFIVDINRLKEVTGEKNLRHAFEIMKNISEKDESKLYNHIIKSTNEMLDELNFTKDDEEFFRAYLEYTLTTPSTLTDENRSKVVENITEHNKIGRGFGMSILDEYFNKGKAEGMVKGKAEVAKQALKMGISVEQIVMLTGLSKDLVFGLMKKNAIPE